jgi:hypothetical protein
MDYGLSIVTINQQSVDTPDHRYIIQSCQAIVQGKTKENIMTYIKTNWFDIVFTAFLISPFFIL